MRMSLAAAALFVLGSQVASAAAAKLVDPDVVIREAADRTFEVIQARRAEFEKDPSGLQAVAEEMLLPHFDVDYATRLVLGKYWAAATPDQQARFRAVFVDFLMRTYAKGMLEFDREGLTINPVRGATDPRRTIVRTSIKRRTGQTVPVDYTLRMTPAGWKVFDITIEGISYVLNYRNSFAEEIEQKGTGDAGKGIEAVITRLGGLNDTAAGSK